MSDVTPLALLIGQLERLLSRFSAGQRLKFQGEVAGDMMAEIKALLAKIAQSPEFGLALGALAQIGRNLLQEQLEKAQLNPCETMEPVRHIREAYEAIEQAIAEIGDLAQDRRFGLTLKSFVYPLEIRLPLSEIIKRIDALEGHLIGAGQHANMATNKALRLRDYRTTLGAQTTGMPATLQDTNTYLVRLPETPYHSEHEAVKRIRDLMLLFAAQLHETVGRGRRRLERGAVDKAGEMVRPSTVSAALLDLNDVLWCALLTCAALARLATESQQK